MSSSITTAVVGLKTLMLLLGGSITFYAVQAYRTTGSRALRALALGFGTVTFGAMLAGVVDLLLPVDTTLALVIESLFTTAGFAVVLASLYIE